MCVRDYDSVFTKHASHYAVLVMQTWFTAIATINFAEMFKPPLATCKKSYKIYF